MYRALAWTLGTFVTLFTTLTIMMLAADGSHEQSWQWKWEWTQVVSWEVCLAGVIKLCGAFVDAEETLVWQA